MLEEALVSFLPFTSEPCRADSQPVTVALPQSTPLFFQGQEDILCSLCELSMFEVPREILRAQFSVWAEASLRRSIVLHIFTGIEIIFSKGRKRARMYRMKEGLETCPAGNKMNIFKVDDHRQFCVDLLNSILQSEVYGEEEDLPSRAVTK